MSHENRSSDPNRQTPIYQIRVKGHLEDHWASRFDGMVLTLEPNGDTTLTGPVVDQAALHSLLRQIRDVGLPLIAVTRLDEDEPSEAASPDEGMGGANESTI
ncbi:MAG: hypothetical protein AAF125_00780 [Chloroflexota bacterium]